MVGIAPRRVLTVGAAVAVSSLLLAGCSGSSGETAASVTQDDIDTAMETETTLDFWTWVPDIEDEVAAFEEEYPAISVNVENVGQGQDHYARVRAAIAAGQGAPDVIQVEYPYISSFQLTEDLLDLRPYVGDDLDGTFVDWVWNQVTRDEQILAIPQDTGPMGNLYRSDILESAGLAESPATWDDFATAASTVKDATGSYITNLPPNDAGLFIGKLWQAGVKPFSYDGGQTIGVDLDSAEAVEVAEYWQGLIEQDLVSVDPNFTDSWYQGLANGKYAGWITAAWGPVFLQGTAGDTAGLWRAAPLPQYGEGENVSANLGGSSDAVLASSDSPIPAAMLAEYINTNADTVSQFNTQQSLYPASNELLASDDFLAVEAPFYGGQQVNELFAEVSETVDSEFEWLPFQDYVASSFNETLGTAIADRGDLAAGLTAWEEDIKRYAADQGFTVEE